jgi:hypothetical protein
MIIPYERVDVGAALQPLLRTLHVYESMVGLLRRKGGTVRDLRRLMEMMRRPIRFPGLLEGPEATLESPARLRDRLRELYAGVELEIRRGPVGFPTHYLYRTSRDFFGNYTLILEDLHRGSDYDGFDARWERFASVTRYGETDRLLRLSPLRFTASLAAGPAGADGVLYLAGRALFDIAWGDEQRLAAAAAELLDMPRFRSALEVLSLCLGSELSPLRQALIGPHGKALLMVVDDADPGGAVAALGRRLVEVEDGALLSRLRQAAHGHFQRLDHEFRELMGTREVFPGTPGGVTLFQVLVANYRRLDALRPHLAPEVLRRAARLDATARELSEALLAPLPVATAA